MFRITCLDCGCADNMQNIQTNKGQTAIRVFPYVLACACGAVVAETPEGLRAARGATRGVWRGADRAARGAACGVSRPQHRMSTLPAV